ncbi:glycoside hydrolase family 75 protein [Aquitalea sp. USM4]|uniref:glycoside hydrolase family 75 protein n=1 Tax=Aquitalea sp. USM4 TaxID=1590041 RepID=UPI0013F15A21|nr:glycoside hydrolase family 75 protein [Aquitalea sp. USM4]
MTKSWPKPTVVIAVLGITVGYPIVACAQVSCDMRLAFWQKDKSIVSGKTAVLETQDATALFFQDRLNVNTDGTRRSYSVSDFWGEKTAVNNLCNAMSDKCAGLDKTGLAARRQLTQKVASQGWPAKGFKQTRISPDIIPLKNGKPCPEVDGYLVSATALTRTKVADVCDLGRYVDALHVPALVIPKNSTNFGTRRAKIGDLVVAMLPDQAVPVYAVVGDSGPEDELGEGSLALNGKILGKSEPINYREIRGKPPFTYKDAWVTPPTAILIFPATRDTKDPYITADRIETAARPLFENWGGVERMRACFDAAKAMKQ